MTPDITRLPFLPRPLAQAMTLLAPWQGLLPSHRNGSSEEEEDANPAIAVSFGALRRCAPGEACVDVTVRSRFGTCAIAAGLELFDALSDRFLPDWRAEAPEALDATWRAVLVFTQLAEQAGLGEAVETIEAVFSSARPKPAPARALHGAIRLEAVSYPFDLVLHEITTTEFARLTQIIRPRRGRLIDPGFFCSLRLPLRQLELSRFKALRAGDAVLSLRVEEGGWLASCRIPGLSPFSARLEADGSIRITQGPSFQPDVPEMTHFVPPSETEKDNHAPRLEVGRVSQLPVFIDVLLTSPRLTLEELGQLAPGTVLDLRIDLSAPVTILANGAAIGTGQLIQCGDYIGVQILNWPSEEGAHHA